MEVSSQPPKTDVTSTALAIRPWQGLVLALAAGVVTWGIVQRVHPVLRVPKQYDVPSIGMPPALFAAHREQQDRVDRSHAMLYLGTLGFLIAAALAAREAVARRLWLLPLLAGPLGAAGGALGGLLASLMFVYVRTTVGQADLTHLVGAQLLLGVPLGTSIGLGLGLATKTVKGALQAALAGAGAGMLAGVLFAVAVSILLPAASTENLLPEEGVTGLLWLATLAGTIGAVIPIGGKRLGR